jgi:hypothetical protein
VPLGPAPAGSTIKFEVLDATGFEARAILLRDTETIATWVSSELIGIPVSEALVVAGFYTLQITCVFTNKKPGTVNIEFQINGGAKVPVSFSGQRPDVARAIADVFIV